MTIPTHSTEAEMSALGSMLLSGNAAKELSKDLTPELSNFRAVCDRAFGLDPESSCSRDRVKEINVFLMRHAPLFQKCIHGTPPSTIDYVFLASSEFN